MAMIDLIKEIAISGVNAGVPVAICYGTVLVSSPIEVTIDQRFTLSDDMLIITEYIKNLSLSVGDRLLLLRVQGGQEYVILDRLVD